MDEVYLEIYSLSETCLAPIETIVTLFTIKYCQSRISIKLLKGKPKAKERAYAVDITDFTYEIIDITAIPYCASSCELPNITVNKTSCIAGLCATLRQIIKKSVLDCSVDYCRSLLGFKESCLLACSEVSIWTKFCEVDLIHTLKSLNIEESDVKELPISVARFECHMSQPIRLHNLYKYTMSKKFARKNAITGDEPRMPEHTHAEGSHITLADIIIFVCMHILLSVLHSKTVLELLPLTRKWYEKMKDDKIILKCLDSLSLQRNEEYDLTEYVLPTVANQSLYKCDPKRYKPRSRIYTRQEDINYSLQKFGGLKINLTLDPYMFNEEESVDWTRIPFDATPEGGSLPTRRLQRKCEQLENLCKPVVNLANPGDVIVDFCSGSGHLGILIAHLLPKCMVILLENKEESLNRAKERVKKLQLTNVKFYQCNLDYFKGNFDIGTSLHACGVATDLVIQQCIRNDAIFVCCPCCYGAVQDCHQLTYPRSEIFKHKVDNVAYKFISHAADQTHDKENVKTKQGYECMTIVDVDRKLQAEQFEYKVYLSKLVPETCTPKNHILIGIPKQKL